MGIGVEKIENLMIHVKCYTIGYMSALSSTGAVIP